MKKKFLSVVLSVAMAATLLVGCGSTGDSSSDTQTPAAEESTDTAEGTDATDASADKGADPADYKVVMVVKQSDSWFDDMATGIEQLKKDTGLKVSVQVPETGDAASQISIMEDLIAQDVKISHIDDTHVKIGDFTYYCTSPRNHVKSAGKITGFTLMKEMPFDSKLQRYLLVGLVAHKGQAKLGEDIDKLERIY